MSNDRVRNNQLGKPSLAQTLYGGVYVGFVKDNTDQQKMGRLRVWIPELSGDPNDESKWFTVRYVSPFAGASSPRDTLIKGSRRMEDSQQSYGWWAIPPDLENEVVVTFANGDPGRGLVMGFLYQQYMNEMVPGIASAQTFPEQDSGAGVNPPVTEYNKWANDPAIKPPDPLRPRFNPLHDGLYRQGLYGDDQRGPTTASARRDDVAKVYGMKSPRGHQLYIDDAEGNEYIRFRTRSGAQVLIHDTEGYVYVISGNGNSWVEISDTGIDLYTNRSFSVRAKQDVNLRADRNVNIEAGQDVNIRSGGGEVKIEASAGSMSLRSKGVMNLETASSMAKKIGSNLVVSTGGNISIGAAGAMILTSPMIRQNSGGGETAEAAESPQRRDLPDAVLTPPHYPATRTLNTIVSRLPHHEPWKREGIAPPVSVEQWSGGDSYTGQQNSANAYQKKEQQRANSRDAETEGGTKIQQKETPPAVALKVNVSVEQAIIQAAKKSGMDVGYLFAMAQQESSFDPNARASTSSAKGLYQFLDGTWTGMVKKYGAIYGIRDTNDDKFNAGKNAMMGALFARDNEKAIASSIGGRKATATELYLAHFLGSGGANTFLRADPSASAAKTLPAAAKANKNVFYDRATGKERSIQEVYSFFEKKMEGPSRAYREKYAGQMGELTE